jgi:hypothetical protein
MSNLQTKPGITRSRPESKINQVLASIWLHRTGRSSTVRKERLRLGATLCAKKVPILPIAQTGTVCIMQELRYVESRC